MSTPTPLPRRFRHRIAVCCWCLGFCLASGALLAQPPNLLADKKQLAAQRSELPIAIDGLLSDPAWQTAPVATNFVQNQPKPGAAPSQNTEVKVLYDNTGIYIGAILYDSQPDSIMQELTERDNLGNTDWFGVFIDAYRDGINGFGFITTPADVQFEAKYSVFGEDSNWDAVWISKAQRIPAGWSVEIKIPFATLRFPDADTQVWHVNFGRFMARNREKCFWSELKPQVDGFLNQSGYLHNLENIEAPLRIQATPYLVAYGLHHHDTQARPIDAFGHSFNGGMDIKVGLSDAFTLDMTLIPDFGEAQSDNQVLNLSPFEVRFDENRAFFTEGTELFNKGNLFYSRRIGGRPLYAGQVASQLADDEEIVSNPQNSQLYNATKISGRNAKGLGMGFFNATAGRTYATVRSAEQGDRRILTNPLTNYNVLVIDQNLPHNSYATFVNTTVLREGNAYDANVTGAQFFLRNKPNTYSFSGRTAVSQLYHPQRTDLGHTYNLGVEKTSGRLRAGLNYNVESDTYNPNDLGFLSNNNERSTNSWVNYNWFDPFWKFNRAEVGAWIGYTRLYNPNAFADFAIENWLWGETKNFWQYNLWTRLEPTATFDYFEPRQPGRFYRFPTNRMLGGNINSDGRKRIAFNLGGHYRKFDERNRHTWNLFFSPRFRVNDRLNFRAGIDLTRLTDDVGFVNNYDTTFVDPSSGESVTRTDIIFGQRHRTETETSLRANYTFNANMSLSFRLRHYWSSVRYQRFNRLETDGRLGATSYTSNHNGDFDAFNIDLIYRWRFAPGSDLIVVYKNSLFSFTDNPSPNYWRNLNGLFTEPQDNSLSIKLIYFLDYATLAAARSHTRG